MVKCAECGFLASRNVQSRQLEETEQEIRLEGDSVIAWNTGKPMGRFEPPVCFMRSPDYEATPFTRIADKEATRFEIQMERTCESFTLWQQGFTPKEHREMIDRQWMLDFQAKREQEDREWRTAEEKDRRK